MLHLFFGRSNTADTCYNITYNTLQSLFGHIAFRSNTESRTAGFFENEHVRFRHEVHPTNLSILGTHLWTLTQDAELYLLMNMPAEAELRPED